MGHYHWWHPDVVSTLHRHRQPNIASPPDKTVDHVHMYRRKGGASLVGTVGDVIVGPAPKMGTVYQWEEGREQGCKRGRQQQATPVGKREKKGEIHQRGRGTKTETALLQTWTGRWTVSEADKGPRQRHKCWRKNVIEVATPCADSVKSKTEQPTWC